MFTRLSDFVVCGANLYIVCSGFYISGLEHIVKLKLSV